MQQLSREITRTQYTVMSLITWLMLNAAHTYSNDYLLCHVFLVDNSVLFVCCSITSCSRQKNHSRSHKIANNSSAYICCVEHKYCFVMVPVLFWSCAVHKLSSLVLYISMGVVLANTVILVSLNAFSHLHSQR